MKLTSRAFRKSKALKPSKASGARLDLLNDNNPSLGLFQTAAKEFSFPNEQSAAASVEIRC